MLDPFNFPVFTEMPDEAFEGKTPEELHQISLDLDEKFDLVDDQYKRWPYFSRGLVAAYRAAREPLEASAGKLGLVFYEHIKQSARVEAAA